MNRPEAEEDIRYRQCGNNNGIQPEATPRIDANQWTVCVKARTGWRGSEIKWNWSPDRWWKLILRNTSRRLAGHALWAIVSFPFNLCERERRGKRKIDSSDLENRFVAIAIVRTNERVRLNPVAVPRPVTGQRNTPLNKLPRSTVGKRQDENRSRRFSIEERDDLWSVARASPLAVCEKSQQSKDTANKVFGRESRQGRPETASWCIGDEGW